MLRELAEGRLGLEEHVITSLQDHEPRAGNAGRQAPPGSAIPSSRAATLVSDDDMVGRKLEVSRGPRSSAAVALSLRGAVVSFFALPGRPSGASEGGMG
jgi:hypothetical protein